MPRQRVGRKPGGGAATGGGINFQAAVTAITGAHLLRGSPIGWLPIRDVPVAIWAESEGAGDDLRLEIHPNLRAEVQAKKGLGRSTALWTSLTAIISEVKDGKLDYGLLAVAPDSSGTIGNDLSTDIERLGQGRTDHLTAIGAELHKKAEALGGDWQSALQRVRIRVVHAIDAHPADIKAAKEALRWVCADDSQVDAAWNALYRDAIAQIEHRGRWTLPHLLRLFGRQGIAIRDADFPAAVASKLAAWVKATRSSFAIPSVQKALDLGALIDMRTVGTMVAQPESEDAQSALARYHDVLGQVDRDATIFNAEWTGRFRRHAVIVAGPGLGKSTLLNLLARSYATDGFAVLNVKLKTVATAMGAGWTFERALLEQGLDGSGVSAEAIRKANLADLLILADGLDDCGGQQSTIASALAAFAVGHPSARIVVTTRPIGYTTPAFSSWSHYRLLAPEKERGAENLGRLLGALADKSTPNNDANVLARAELDRSRVGEVISTSPLLLCMAAALISKTGKLPETRPRLYADLIRLFEFNDKANARLRPQEVAIAGDVLDYLGWLVIKNPLTTINQLSRTIGERFAGQLGCTPLNALEPIEAVTGYWETRGVIEQVHHLSTSYWTFTHKTFAEFAAARHVSRLDPIELSAELNRIVDLPDWHEVVVFAGGIGIGKEIAHLYANRRTAGGKEQMERALKFVRDKDVEISAAQVKELAVLAFDAIQEKSGDQFSIGLALTEVAKAHPEPVAAVAELYLLDDRPWVRLTGWATAIVAGRRKFESEELANVLSDLLPTIAPTLKSSLLGGLLLGRHNDRDLVGHIAIAALAARSDTDLVTYSEFLLAHRALDMVSFHSRVASVLRARGVVGQVVESKANKSWRVAMSLLAAPTEWKRDFSEAIRGIAQAFSPTSSPVTSQINGRSLLQFQAVLELLKFNKASASDISAWTVASSKLAVAKVLRALVRSSQIDLAVLGAESALILRQIDIDDGFDCFDLIGPTVDIPDPNWEVAAKLVDDESVLLEAMNQGSRCMAYIAGNMLVGSKGSSEQSKLLLARAAPGSLWAAASVVQERHSGEVSNTILLDRLSGALSDGTQHLFEGLEKGLVNSSPPLCDAICRGLASENGAVAAAAASLAESLGKRGQGVAHDVLLDAYDDWLKREPTERRGVIPESPRETLLRVLVSEDALDDARLFAALADHRLDVRDYAEKHVTALLARSDSYRQAISSQIASRSFAPATVANILRSQAPFTVDQIRTMKSLLQEPEAKWRRAGVELLRSVYMTTDEIKTYSAALSQDSEDEIRSAAAYRLKSEVANSAASSPV